jgi:hypothetical protein
VLFRSENCFYEWWRTEEYRFEFEDEAKQLQFIKEVNSKPVWIFEGCRWLITAKNLEWQQVYWYYNKWKGYISKDNIKQEYPCTPDEAFLASGSCIFDKEKIIQRKEYLKKYQEENPPRRGDFIITWNNPEIMDKPVAYAWVDNVHGNIKIYNDPILGHPYTLGGDTKGEGSDWFSGTIKNNHNGIRCATLHMQGFKSKPYAAQMWALAMYYNEAIVGIEANFNTYPVELFTDWNYPRQYMREKTDTITKEVKKQFGWRTDGNTRPLIIEREITAVEEDIDCFYDIPTLDEMLTFIKDDEGRYDAEEGKHDDLLFSDMIADAIGSQQSRQIEAKQEPIDPFLFDDDGDGTHRERHYGLGGFFD